MCSVAGKPAHFHLLINPVGSERKTGGAPGREQCGSASHLNRVGIVSDTSVLGVDTLPARVDLLRVDAVLGVEILHLTVGEDTVNCAIDLELVPKLCKKCQALLLARKLQQIWSLSHCCCATCWHLEDGLLLAFPCDHVELFHLHISRIDHRKFCPLDKAPASRSVLTAPGLVAHLSLSQ